jgi:hypothetical protein
MLARENTGKCCFGKLAPAEIQMAPILATGEPRQTGGSKDKIGSAVGLLQCSWPRMMVPRRVGIEMLGDPGCLQHLALSSRFRGEPVSLGSAGSGWTGGWPPRAQHTAPSAAVFQCSRLPNRRRFRRNRDVPCAPRKPFAPWPLWTK